MKEMAEYIEKQALLKKMHSLHTTPLLMGHTIDEDVMFKTMVSIVEEQPTADVVEVVRCGQCKYWKINPHNMFGGQCRYSECAAIDHYCSYGERKCNND